MNLNRLVLAALLFVMYGESRVSAQGNTTSPVPSSPVPIASTQTLMNLAPGLQLVNATRDLHFVGADWEWGNRAFSVSDLPTKFVSTTGQIQVWNTDLKKMSAHESGSIAYHGFALYSLRVSSDGAMVAAPCSDARTRLWRVRDKKLLHTWVTPFGQRAYCCAFSPGGNLLMIGGGEYVFNGGDVPDRPQHPNLHLYDVASGEELESTTLGFRVVELEWAPDQSYFVAGTDDWNFVTVAGGMGRGDTARAYISTWDNPIWSIGFDNADKDGMRPYGTPGPTVLMYGPDHHTLLVAPLLSVEILRSQDPTPLIPSGIVTADWITDKYRTEFSTEPIAVSLAPSGNVLECAQGKVVRWFDVRPVAAEVRAPVREQTVAGFVNWIAQTDDDRVLLRMGTKFAVLRAPR